MKCIGILFCYVVIGCMLSVGVAVACFKWAGLETLQPMPIDEPSWLENVAADAPRIVLRQRANDFGFFGEYYYCEGDDVVGTLCAARSKVGWPVYLLHGGFWINSEQYPTFWRSMPVSAVGLFANNRDDYSFPIGIAWPGLLVNTVVYGTLTWVVTWGPLLLRRYLRNRAVNTPGRKGG
jgi:hypothetical protein